MQTDGVVHALKRRAAKVRPGHRIVFDVDCDGNDKSHAINLMSGKKAPLKLRNRVWVLDVRIIPAGRPDDILRRESDKPEDVCPFGRHVRRP